MPDEFDEILDRWDDHRSEQNQKTESARAQRDQFLDEFETWVENVAKPVMDEIAQRVQGRGYVGRVQRVAPSAQPTEGRPGIELEVGPAEAKLSAVRFTPASFHNAVGVWTRRAQSNSTSSGPVDNRPMDELDSDVIRTMTMDLVKATFTPRQSN